MGGGLKTSYVLVDGHASGIAHTSFFVDRCASGVEKNWMCLLLLDVFQGSRNIDVFVAERVVAMSPKNIKLFWVPAISDAKLERLSAKSELGS